jgi:hypothetical protein
VISSFPPSPNRLLEEAVARELGVEKGVVAAKGVVPAKGVAEAKGDAVDRDGVVESASPTFLPKRDGFGALKNIIRPGQIKYLVKIYVLQLNGAVNQKCSGSGVAILLFNLAFSRSKYSIQICYKKKHAELQFLRSVGVLEPLTHVYGYQKDPSLI